MRRIALLVLLLIGPLAFAQTISYFNQGLLRQPTAAADKAYLGITGGGGTNFYYTNTTYITNTTYVTNNVFITNNITVTNPPPTGWLTNFDTRPWTNDNSLTINGSGQSIFGNDGNFQFVGSPFGGNVTKITGNLTVGSPYNSTLGLSWSGNQQALNLFSSPIGANAEVDFISAAGAHSTVEFRPLGVVSIGPSLVFSGTAYGNGAGITNIPPSGIASGSFVKVSGDTMTGPLVVNSSLSVNSPMTNYARLELYSDPTNLFPALSITNLYGRVSSGDAVTPMAIEVGPPNGTVLMSVAYDGTISSHSFIGGSFAVGALSGITSGGLHYGDGSGLTNVVAKSLYGFTAATNGAPMTVRRTYTIANYATISSANRYCGIEGYNNATLLTTQAGQTALPWAGYFTNITLYLSSAMITTTNLIVTLQTNGVDSGLTATLLGGQTLTNATGISTLVLPVGTRYNWRVVFSTGSMSAVPWSIGTEFVSTGH